MSIWDLNKLPRWKNRQKHLDGIVATDRGFEDARTGEILVAIRTLSDKEGPSVIESAAFDKDAYVQGDPVNIAVTFVERVICGAATSLVINWSGVSGNITANALAFPNPAGQNVVLYSAVVPSEAGVLSLSAQSIAGGIFDALDSRPLSNTAISAQGAADAGSRTVV